MDRNLKIVELIHRIQIKRLSRVNVVLVKNRFECVTHVAAVLKLFEHLKRKNGA